MLTRLPKVGEQIVWRGETKPQTVTSIKDGSIVFTDRWIGPGPDDFSCFIGRFNADENGELLSHLVGTVRVVEYNENVTLLDDGVEWAKITDAEFSET